MNTLVAVVDQVVIRAGSETLRAAGLRADTGVASGSTAQAGDIIVVANRFTMSLMRAMSAYQFARYTAQYGEQSFAGGAEWALRLREPTSGYNFGALSQTPGATLRAMAGGPYDDRSFNWAGRDWTSRAAAERAGMQTVTAPPTIAGMRQALLFRPSRVRIRWGWARWHTSERC